MPVQEQKHAVHISTKIDNQVFNIVHLKKHRFHALLKYFGLKTYERERKYVFLYIQATAGVLSKVGDLTRACTHPSCF